MKEQANTLTSLDTIIELTDEELDSMRGGHRHGDDCDRRFDDDCGRRFGETASFDFQESFSFRESFRYSTSRNCW